MESGPRLQGTQRGFLVSFISGGLSSKRQPGLSSLALKGGIPVGFVSEDLDSPLGHWGQPTPCTLSSFPDQQPLSALTLTIRNGFSKDSIMLWAFFCATVRGAFPFSSALGSCRNRQKTITYNCNHSVTLRCKQENNNG